MATTTVVTTFGIVTYRVHNDRSQLLGVFETLADAEGYIAELADAYAHRYGTDVMSGMDCSEELPDMYELVDGPTLEEWNREREIEARASDWLKERDNALGIKRLYELDEEIPF